MNGDESQPRGRRGLVTAIVVLASIVAAIGIFDIWINRQALNTDNWTDASTRLLEKKEIRDAVAAYLVAELYANVDVQAEVRRLLPGDTKPLAGPAASGLKELAKKGAVEALQTTQFQQAWERANRDAHRLLMQILEGGNEAVSTTNGVVVLDLRSLVAQLADQVGINGDLAEKLPPKAGKLEILRSNELGLAQDIATTIRGLAVLLTVLALALYALAIFLAGGWRRKAFIGCGVGLAAAGLAALVIRRLAGGVVVNALVTTEATKPAAEQAWSVGTSLLVTGAVATVIYGMLFVLAGALAGPSRPAVAIRRTLAPFMNERYGVFWGVVAAIVLLILLWGPVPATREPLGVLVSVGLVALGVHLLHRQVAREFPGASLADSAHGARQALNRLKVNFGRGGAAARGAVAKARAPGGLAVTEARLDRLERLAALKERGALTEEEFQVEKAAILASEPA